MIWDAVLVDLDGTLVETQTQHDQALTAATRTGGSYFHQFYAGQFTGRSAERLRAYAATHGHDVENYPQMQAEIAAIGAAKWACLAAILETCDAATLDPHGDSRAALTALEGLGVPLRIVTDTPLPAAAQICQILGWETTRLITRDAVGGVTKPDPAIYTLARLSLGAQHPIALEDTLRGIHSASAAHIPSFLVSGPIGVLAWIASVSRDADCSTTGARPRLSPPPPIGSWRRSRA